jgi:hypothetical protein
MIQHPILGDVEYRDEYGGRTFKGQITLGAEQAQFNLWEPDPDFARLRLDQVAGMRDPLTAQVAEAKSQAAAHLLPLKNERWTEEDGSLVTAEQFIERMQLEHLDFRPTSEGRIDFTFSDGDLFFGHAIQLSILADGTYTEARIAG